MKVTYRMCPMTPLSTKPSNSEESRDRNLSWCPSHRNCGGRQVNILNIVREKKEKEARLKQAQLSMTKRYTCTVTVKS